MAPTHNDYTVGWVCALPKEQTAATAMLDRIHVDLPKPRNDHNTYTLGSIGKHNIVIACLPKGKVGNNSAATVAAQMISTFPLIKFGLMVGIGGGVPPKVRLGDVVVSTQVDEFPGVVQWDFGKAEQGGNFKRTGALNNPPNVLLTALAKLETEHEMKGSKIPQYLEDLKEKWPRLAPKYIKSDSLEDVLFKAQYGHISKSTADDTSIADNKDSESSDGEDGDEEEKSCRFCDKTKIAKRKPRDMLVHYGLIASGNQVIQDAAFRDALNKSLGGSVLCIEMEAAGLVNEFPCIVIRGICDYADSHKNKDWQEHAAAVAAAFAKELLSVVPAEEVEQMPTIKGIYDRLEAISNDVNELRSRHYDQEHQAILDWLTPVDYGPQQSDYIRLRQAGTGQWLLDSAEFQKWIKTSKQTLFCPGIPGAGKTIITSIIVENLCTRFQNDANIGIAYLYCNFRRQDEQKPEDLLASLLKQLVQEQPSIPKYIKSLHERHRDKRTRPLFNEISNALHSVIVEYSRVFVIIDALDECEVSNEGYRTLLSEVFKLQAMTGANLFATSRDNDEIMKQFEGSLKIEIRATNEDVQRYLNEQMLLLQPDILDDGIRDMIRKEIVKAIDGMFLLAQLHMNTLRNLATKGDIKQALQNLTKGIEALDKTYEQAIERIENQGKGFRELAKRILAWIIHAKRPLSTAELRHALAVKPHTVTLDEDYLPSVKVLRSVCAGLVTIDKESNIVRLIHYTTQEYFERTQTRWFPNAQTDITRTCVTYLLFDIFETGFCPTDETLEERQRLNALYDYAARNWGHHACETSAEVVEKLILDFLKSKTKVSSSSQAMFASKSHWLNSNYSQEVPKQIIGLHLAAYFGLKGVTIILLKNEHDLDFKDTYGRTPLSWAAQNGHEAVVKLLLEKGAEPDSKDTEGQTPLLWAAQNGNEAVVKLLLEKGAELDSKDKNGRMLLLWAAENGHEAIVKLLLEKGAKLDSKDKNGGTPLSWAAENGHKAIVKLLLEKGAEPGSKDVYGWTPLSRAARNGHEAVVKLLLEKGAELDSKHANGQTSLSWAAENGHEAVVKLLLEKGAELDSKDTDGRTPLWWAAENGHNAVVKLLLEKGAELDSRDTDGRTPLSWAARYGQEAVRKLIEAAKHSK